MIGCACTAAKQAESPIPNPYPIDWGQILMAGGILLGLAFVLKPRRK